MDEGNIDAREASRIDWRHVFFSDRMRSAYYQGLVIGAAWPAFVFLCALSYSVGQMEGTELAHHIQNAVAIFSWTTIVFLALGTGLGFLMFLDITDERSLIRFLGYASVGAPLLLATFAGGGFDFYEPPRDPDRIIEIDVGRAIDWWNGRSDD